MADVNELFSKVTKEMDEKNYDAALATIEEIKKIDPTFKRALHMEVCIWEERKNYVQEYYATKRLLGVLDYSSTAGKNYASVMLSQLGGECTTLGLMTEAKESFEMMLKLSELPAIESVDRAIYFYNLLEDTSAEEFRKLYAYYEKYTKNIVPYPRKFYKHEKIRVGFLSADFHRHTMMTWSYWLLIGLNKNLFETYFYSNTAGEDNITKYLRERSDAWHDIKELTDEEAAKLIRDDEIDILFDLSGYTIGKRHLVAAYHPASVQMSGVGYMNSTGLKCFEYFLSDEICAGDENFFVEKLVKLPRTHICYEPFLAPKIVSEPPCVKNNFVTFGTFNRSCKISDSMLHAWKEILDAVPDSRLILKNDLFNTDDGKEFFQGRLKRFGFEVERVELRPFASGWMSEYNDVDIALDTFPYTGGVTTCEALYMGVPVVSLYGNRHGTRFGLSILNNVGLEGLAVSSYDDYVKRAVALANSRDVLVMLRKELRGEMERSPLMDYKAYLPEVQDLFVKILEEQRNLHEAK